ncbi:hypothetical protein PRIPAC_81350, partial [Pristionchus pacificus]
SHPLLFPLFSIFSLCPNFYFRNAQVPTCSDRGPCCFGHSGGCPVGIRWISVRRLRWLRYGRIRWMGRRMAQKDVGRIRWIWRIWRMGIRLSFTLFLFEHFHDNFA